MMRTLAALAACLGILAAQDAAREAGAAREQNRLDDAIRLYRKAVQDDPKWTEGWWYLGTLLYDRDDYAEAAPAFNRAAALDPKSGTTLVMLGLSEARLGKNSDALEHLQLGRTLGIPDDPQLRHVLMYNLGMLWIERGNDRDDFDRAQEVLDALVREGVESEEIAQALGLAVLRMRPPPENAGLVKAAGNAEVLAARRLRPGAAAAAYEQLAAAYPKTTNVQFALGKFLLAQGEDDRAVVAFRRELENTPNHLLATVGAAGILSRTDPAAAVPFAEKAVKLAPALPEGHYLLGLSLVGKGELSAGILELETARTGAPGEAKIYFALGRAYVKAKRPADAAKARAMFQQLNDKREPAQP